MKPRVNLLVIGLLLSLAACSRPVPGLPLSVLAPATATPPGLLTPAPTRTEPPAPTGTALPTAAPAPTVLPTVSPTATALPPAMPLRSFTMVDARTGWGASDEAVLRTTDGGRSWSEVTPDGAELSGGAVPQVYAGDARTAWLLVPDATDYNHGTLYRTRDGGQTWQSAPVPFGGAAIQFLNPDRAFLMAGRGVAAGSQAVDIYTSGDGGGAWTLLCSIDPLQAGEKCLPFGGSKNGLTFRDGLHGWLGGFMPVEGVTYLYATLDGGKTWRQVQLPLPAGFEKAQVEVNSPSFFGEQAGVLVVRVYLSQDFGSVAAQIFFRTRDGGQTWQAAPPMRSVGLVALASAEDWVVWDGGTLHATRDGGQNWQAVNPNVDLTEKLTLLQFIDANTGWAQAMEEDNTRLYYTTDGGHTWQ